MQYATTDSTASNDMPDFFFFFAKKRIISENQSMLLKLCLFVLCPLAFDVSIGLLQIKKTSPSRVS